MSTLYYLIGPPQAFSCQCWCLLDTSYQCNLIWERVPTVSCNPLQFNVSVTGADGTPVYSDRFDQSIASTQATSLNKSSVYRATVTAKNACGSITCSANCSSGREKAGWLSLWLWHFHIYLPILSACNDWVQLFSVLPKLPLGQTLSYHKKEPCCIYVKNVGPWNAFKYLSRYRWTILDLYCF